MADARAPAPRVLVAATPSATTLACAVLQLVLVLPATARAALPAGLDTTGLVAYYPFDGTLADASGNGHDATNAGADFGADKAGAANKALHFSGSDIVTLPAALTDGSDNLQQTMTVTALIKPTTNAGANIVVAAWNDGTSKWRFIFKEHNSNNQGRVEWSRSSHADLGDQSTATPYSAGVWNHVAITFNFPAGLAQMYTNGKLDSIIHVSAPMDSDAVPITIGAALSGSTPAEGFDGIIDEVTIWSRALAGPEIQLLGQQFGMAPAPWSTSILPFDNGLVAYYPLAGTNGNDASGNGNDGFITGATSVANYDGAGDSALTFDGDDVVRVPYRPALELTDAITVCAVVKLTSNAAPHVIVSKWNDGGSQHDFIWKRHNSNTKQRLELSKTTHTDLMDISSKTGFTTNEWVFVAFSFEKATGTGKLWRNGHLESIGRSTVDVPLAGDDVDLTIGAATPTAEGWAGVIDEVSVWNRALSGHEMQSLAAAYGFAPAASSAVVDALPYSNGLLAMYDFAGGFATDATGNGHDGLIVGASATADRDGNANSALSFSSGHGVKIAETASFTPADALTVLAMVRPTDTSGPRVIFSSWDDGGGAHRFIYKIANSGTGVQRIELSSGVGASHTGLADLHSNTVLATDTWHLVGFTFSAADGRVRLYHNGFADGDAATDVGTSIALDGSPIGIGAAFSSGSPVESFVGAIDTVTVWNRALSAAEMYEMGSAMGVASPKFTPEDAQLPVVGGIVAYYSFIGAGDGGQAVDGQGSNVGAVTGAKPAVDIDGFPGRALRFDGDDYIRIPASDDFDSLGAGFTVTALAQPTGFDGANTLVAKWSPGCSGCGSEAASFVWFDTAEEDHRLQMQMSHGGSSGDLGGVVGDSSLVLNQWQHVATTFDAATGKVRTYINGVLDKEADVAIEGGEMHSSTAVPLTIGAYIDASGAVTSGWVGMLDEVAVYNAALTGDEIKQLATHYGLAGARGACELNAEGLCESFEPPASDEDASANVRVRASAAGGEAALSFEGAAAGGGDEPAHAFKLARSVADASANEPPRLYLSCDGDVLATSSRGVLEVNTRLVVQNRELTREIDALHDLVDRLERRVAALEGASS